MTIGGARAFCALWGEMAEEVRERTRLRFLSRVVKLDNGCWQFHKPTVVEPQFALTYGGRTAILAAVRASWILFRGTPLPEMSVRCPTLRHWCINHNHLTARTIADIPTKRRSPDPTPEQHEILLTINFLKYSDAAELYGVTRERIRQLCSPSMRMDVKVLTDDRRDLQAAIHEPAPTVRELAHRLRVPTFTAARWLRTYGERLREEQFDRLREMRDSRRSQLDRRQA